MLKHRCVNCSDNYPGEVSVSIPCPVCQTAGVNIHLEMEKLLEGWAGWLYRKPLKEFNDETGELANLAYRTGLVLGQLNKFRSR